MTMTDIHTWVRETDHIQEQDFIRLGEHFIGPIQTQSQPEYSDALRKLVRECLNPRVSARPIVSDVVTRTRTGLERYRTTSRTGKDTTKGPALRHLNRSKSALPPGYAVLAPQVPPAAANSPLAGPAVTNTGVSPSDPTWEPRRGLKRERAPDQEIPPIGNLDSDVPPAKLPPGIMNEGDGKQELKKGPATDQEIPLIELLDSDILTTKLPPAIRNEREGKRGLRRDHAPEKEISPSRVLDGDILPAKLPPEIGNEREGKRRRPARNEGLDSGKKKKTKSTDREIIIISDDKPDATKGASHIGPVDGCNEDEYRSRRVSNSSRGVKGNLSTLIDHENNTHHQGDLNGEGENTANADARREPQGAPPEASGSSDIPLMQKYGNEHYYADESDSDGQRP
jgi:hypothetical protein